jgi:hypothetical protein
MNTYSAPLTKQELRHGRWFGHFSRACERLALRYVDFWDENKILTPRKMARMGDVQLIASLLIAQMDGMQDRNESIETFYRDHDETFENKKVVESRFRTSMEQIGEAVGDILVNTQFRRPAHFYTLFCVTYHRLFGMPKAKLATAKSKVLSESDQDNLKDALTRLSSIITAAKEYQSVRRAHEDAGKKLPPRTKPYPDRYHDFANAVLVQTDNIAPRRQRFETLYNEAFG